MLAKRYPIRKAAAIAAAVFTLTTTAGPALGASDGGHGSRQVAFTTTQGLVGGDFACDPTDPTRCAGTFRNVQTLSGDLSGSAYAVGSAFLLPEGRYQGQSIVQFTGSVAGCGTGSLVIIETGVLDPVTGDTFGTWTVVAGQGTGDLAQTSGDGTADTRINDATTGSIRCR